MTTEILFTILLLILCLAGAAANFLHWCGRAGEKFFYFPEAGVPRVINTVWLIAVIASIFLSRKILPFIALLAIVCSWQVVIAAYSIWFREKQRR